MEIEILEILDKSDLAHERVVFKVNEDCNCWPFILFRNKGVRSESRPYIFNNIDVEKGDVITLYTKKGDNRKDRLGNGMTNHILYWGLNISIWDCKDCIALLVKTDKFEFKKIK